MRPAFSGRIWRVAKDDSAVAILKIHCYCFKEVDYPILLKWEQTCIGVAYYDASIEFENTDMGETVRKKSFQAEFD